MQALLILETLTRLRKAKEILVVKMVMMMTIVLEKDSKLQVNKFSDSDDDDSLNESHQLQGKREAER